MLNLILKFINEELRARRTPVFGKKPGHRYVSARAPKTSGAANSLDALCTRYGIDRSRRTKHGALIDTQILAEVYLELKCGRQKSLSFHIQKEVRKIQHVGLQSIRLKPLIIELTSMKT